MLTVRAIERVERWSAPQESHNQTTKRRSITFCKTNKIIFTVTYMKIGMYRFDLRRGMIVGQNSRRRILSAA